MRKLLLSFISIVLSAVILPFAGLTALAEEDSRRIYYNEEFIYEVQSDDTCSILYYIGECVSVTVPADIDGRAVQSIGERAFYGTKVKDVVISDGIRSIMEEAFFYCTELEEVTLPKSLEQVGTGAFRDCFSLKSVNLLSEFCVFGSYVFYGCTSLENINLPVYTWNVPAGMFSYCQSLRQINLPDRLTEIGEYAFYASGLESLELPCNVDSIGKKAFARCTSLTSVTVNDKWISYVAQDAFEGCDVSLPDGFVDSDAPQASADPTAPTDESVSATESTEAPGYSGEDTTLDEIGTDGVEEPTEDPTAYTEDCIVENNYFIGPVTDMQDFESRQVSFAHQEVEQSKKELLSLAWNVRTVGDANNDNQVNIKDATKIQCFVAGLADENDADFNYKNADVDTDGKVTVRDATQIQKIVAGIVKSLY